MTHATVYNRMIMPTSYGDPLAEYWRIINDVSIWDVAVERQVEVAGPDAFELVQRLCARDLQNCVIGKGKYVPVCDHAGHLINDPVLLRIEDDRFWFSIADSDLLLWARAVASERGLDVSVSEPDVAPLAMQGPKAEAVVVDLLGDWVKELKLFWFKDAKIDDIPIIVARSGWSKQGGFEFYLQDGARGVELWDKVMEAGAPFGIGPGAPNAVERIESGLLSYGSDTDDFTDPFEAGMGRYVSVDSDADFIGKDVLKQIAEEGQKRQRIGLFIADDAPVPSDRKWPLFMNGEMVGFAGSAVWSYRLERNIAVAMIRSDLANIGQSVTIWSNDGGHDAEVAELPFI